MIAHNTCGQPRTPHGRCVVASDYALVVVALLLQHSSALAGAADAEEGKAPADAQAATPFAVSLTEENLGAKVVFHRLEVAGSPHRISLLAPEGYRSESVPEQRLLVLTAPQPATYISVWWIERGERGRLAVDNEAVRRVAKAIHPEAAMVEEYTTWAGGKECPAGVAHWNPAGSLPMAVRIVCIPVGDGCVEVGYVAPRESFAACEAGLAQLLLSFRSGPVGQPIEAPRLSRML